ncbi:MAG: DUF3098 domain-containing protein [Prevotellaceae bacterium]|jgi:hypothetical protein|nr:DUF3098 domain-containing protein [Prevotellaceae bacterium]
MDIKEEKKFTIGTINLKLIGLSFIVIIIGFLLMTGEPTITEYNPDIFSTRRIVVASIIAFFGFGCTIFAIMYKPKNKKGSEK